jgi:hypothetical protein
MLMFAALRPLGAQRPDTIPIDTDRPDFTDATTTVAPHLFQLETGFTLQQGRGTSPSLSRTWPEVLFRTGITNGMELRLGETFESDRAPGAGMPTVTGRDDLNVGTKVRLVPQDGARPALSVEASTSIPTGSASATANEWLPGGAILFGWSTSGPWSAGVEFAGTRQVGDYLQAAASLSVQYTVTSRIQLYGEWFTFQPVDAAGVAGQHYVDSGVLILLSRTVQIDGRGGVGLNGGADRFFTGVGFSIRR